MLQSLPFPSELELCQLTEVTLTLHLPSPVQAVHPLHLMPHSAYQLLPEDLPLLSHLLSDLSLSVIH